ncbi:hypothetical protein [Rhizobium sp. SL86]|uniref:hypothetical protein n=1 Tax=Rhizobium sp. SL86 TaxID=2995148 RepID=UPI00227484DE|nr:hypothetical protein [Rhizobium sp. SL86]MCY1669086.1 hypothetical protein [Rhizobium sp. SL86]
MTTPHLLFSLLLAGSLSNVASAQMQVTPAMRAKAQTVARDCRTDIRTLCARVEPGEGRIAACLRDNREKLSPPCGAALSDLMPR